MKKIAVLFVLLAMLLTVSPVYARADANAPETLAYYDAQIDVLTPYMELFQADYYTMYGHYFQALTSHSSIPSVPTPPDNLSGHPDDQEQDLAYFWNAVYLPDELAWSFTIDIYSGPNGDGYVLNVMTIIDGNVWMRAKNFGPDTWQEYNWVMAVEE